MKLTILFRIYAYTLIPYVIGFLLVPKVIVDFLSNDVLNPAGANISRLFGASLILIIYLSWRGSVDKNSVLRKLIAFGFFIFNCIGTVVSLIGQLVGIWALPGWINIIYFGSFSVGYGYFLFFNKEEFKSAE